MSDTPRYSQIHTDPSLLNKLLQKLKVGNRRGIHLNAIPGRSRNRLDLHDLDVISPGSLKKFLNLLLAKNSFQYEINFEEVNLQELDENERKYMTRVASRLDNTCYDAASNFLQYGVKNFGIGYPMLVKRDEADHTKVITAPLLIWNLDIKKLENKANTWVVSRDPHFPIIINELLRNHIHNDMKVKLDALSDEILDDGIVDHKELQEICAGIIKQLNAQQVGVIDLLNVQKCLDSQQAKRLSGQQASILPMGVFGIYAAQKGVIIDSLEKDLLDKSSAYYDHPAVLTDFQSTTSTPVAIDPSKEQILNTLTDDEIKLIQGPPGTGKSQALTAIISNTISNGGTCLVVCEKQTALNVIYQNLKKIDLSNYCVKVYDVNKDRSDVIRKAREREKESGAVVFSKAHDQTFLKKQAKLQTVLLQYNKQHHASASACWGDKNWKDLVGRYLQLSHEHRGEHVLNEVVLYSNPEYEHFAETRLYIEQMSVLFQKIAISSEHPLWGLSSYFLKENLNKMERDAMRTYFTRHKEIFSAMLQVKESFSGLYEIHSVSPLSVHEFNGVYTIICERIDMIEQAKKSSDYLKENNFEYSNMSSLEHISSIFFEKSRNIKSAKKIINDITRMYSVDSTQSLSEIDQLLKGFLSQSLKDKESAESLIRISETLNNLHQELVRQDDKYYRQTLISIDYFESLHEYYTAIEKELLRVNAIIESLHEVDDLAVWHRAYINSSYEQKEIIQRLMKHPADSWLGIFESWYLYLFLNSIEPKRTFHTNNQSLQHLTKLYSSVKQEQTKLIHRMWSRRAQGAISRVNENSNITGGFSLLYNLRKNKKFNRSNSLRTITHLEEPDGFKIFTDIFPVVLTNPISAESFLPLKPGIFDVVIFDEASQLRLEETYACMLRGQYKIIAGDVHQMPPSQNFTSGISGEGDVNESEEYEIEVSSQLAHSESLLEYASLLPQAKRSYLDYHYRSQHPALINFSNAAIYGDNLVPFPSRVVYTPINFYQIDGLYDDNINQSEIDKIISILKELTPNSGGEYPTIGIATFNIKQRNEILNRIHREVVEDVDFRKIYLQLESHGFWVKNLENIQGDEMDIIILSTTFGKNTDGRFMRRFGPIGQEKGYKLLNVLITRAKYKVIVCTSIPEEEYTRYQDEIIEKGNNRSGILYAYLMYARLIGSEQIDEARSLLNFLKDYSHDAPRSVISRTKDFSESPFEQEVYEALREIVSPEIIEQQHQVGGFRIDMVVHMQGKKIAIECDGKQYHASAEAYAHDMYRQKELESIGYTFYRIWSTNWWDNYDREVKKLDYFLKEQCGGL